MSSAQPGLPQTRVEREPGVLVATEAEVPRGNGWLSAAELATLAGMRAPARRRDWRLGRWVAKRALAAVLGDSVAVEVRAAGDGAPEALVDGRPAPVSISISHREGLGACLVAGPESAVGCDLELVEPRDDALARHFFTPAERVLVDRSGHRGGDLAVALVWSAKESALKALRPGLSVDIRALEVTLDPDSGTGWSWRPLTVRHRAGTLSGWWTLRGRHVLTAVIEPPASPPVTLRL
ncbi:MAG TPA: 4'-phosphopantetheinyl transferase superfamily protein [Candidatus Dormibacteraeota bacterium]|nr:4'-phosphopantetheinyl transferase superfamily protein [Candidatus Dormibacteraeota bacterium]